MIEIWKDIPGYEGLYQVSDQGRVKSLARIVARAVSNGNYVCKERILKASPQDGYPVATLSKAGKARPFKVHSLVMLAFVGPPPPKMEVLHGDGKRGNAKLSNLRYGTRRENMLDAIHHGSMAGVNNGNSKLTREAIEDIVNSYKSFEQELADRHGVSAQTIRNFRTRRTYKRETR